MTLIASARAVRARPAAALRCHPNAVSPGALHASLTPRHVVPELGIHHECAMGLGTSVARMRTAG